MVVGLVIALSALALALAALGLRALRSLLELRLGGIEEKLDRRLADLDTRVDGRLGGLDGRLGGLDGRLLSSQQSAGQAATQIVDRLGKLDGAATQMLQRAHDLARLEQALRPPKARGGVGELLLANLLRDTLPAESYGLQHTFRTGERVDAVVRVDKLVPIDAKFPLDNFERLAAAGDDGERELHERAFSRDVKTHVDAIASKYIRPAEQTYDFALMYLPSESVYYELVCGRTGQLYAYALGKRVFPVSPSTFHAYLAVIVLGLKGLQIERNAEEVMAYCGQLEKDFDRFRTDFDLVGKHIGNAQTKYSEADRRLERLRAGLERATEATALEEGDPVQLPRAVDAA